jgi:TnpA family transposase
LIFALFDLVGLQFSPRLRDLGQHNLYCLNPDLTYQHLGSLLSRPLAVDLMMAHWDELLRVAASLKLRWVTASTLVSKLQAFPR